MTETVRVLFLASDPFHEQARLLLDEEVRAIDHAVQRGRARDRVELIPCFATRMRDLQYTMMRHEPQIVHFAGHGGGNGVLYMGDAYGRPGAVDTETLVTLFGILKECVRVVILNGCETLPIADALCSVVDYAIGMNQPLTDAAAIVFAEAFYGALAMGKTVRSSFELAVLQLGMEERAEAATPELRIRAGVDASVALVTAPPAAAPAPVGVVAGIQPAYRPGDQVITVERLSGNNVRFENRPGPERKHSQWNHIGELSGDGIVFGNG